MVRTRWIVGYGSLLSERSARRTFPTLRHFRIATLRGYRRVFCHASPLFLTRGVADLSSREMAALSVEAVESKQCELLVTVFEVDEEEMPAFYIREEEFDFVEDVELKDLDGTSLVATICVKSSDDIYRRKLGSAAKWAEKVTQYGLDAIWTDEVLPCRIYLKHCWLAAKGHGPDVLDSFLDHTFLSDRKTSMREYLQRRPEILQEEPPPEYIDFYSG
mmetsp:Transcript_20168/g.49420  ORF Transcript_20168/g.49420 Transcript_20168/m.49420 type:complete len:218 (-) Transcript_20168:155-808(-)